MANNAPSTITYNAPHPHTVARLLQYYSSGALTAAATKKEWVIAGYYKILDILIDNATGSLGHDADIIDINVNGTSIFATEGATIIGSNALEPDLRPYQLPGDTGVWQDRGSIRPGTTGGSPNQPNTAPTVAGKTVLLPGDIVSLDVDQVGSGGGSQRVKVCIVLGPA